MAQPELWDEFYDRFQAALTLIEDRSLGIAAPVIYKALARIQEVVSVIPPQPDRQRSKHFNTYVRNIGNFPKAAFVQRQGKWQRRKTGAYEGRVRYTSQQSSKRWGVYVNETDDHRLTGELRNDASYSGWVWGTLDQTHDPHQALFHALTGWVSIDTAIEATRPEIDQMLDQVVTEIAQTLTKET